MPTYKVQAPDGRTFSLEGDSEPTEQELEEVFASMPVGPKTPTGSASIRQTGFMEKSLVPEAILGATRTGYPRAADALEKLTPLAIGEAGPGILATLGALSTIPLTGGASLPAVGMAALGGAGGVGIRRGAQALAGVPLTEQSTFRRMATPEGIPAGTAPHISFNSPFIDPPTLGTGGLEDLKEMVGEGVKQGAFEKLGQLFQRFVGLGPPPDKIMKIAEELGVPTPPSGLVEKIARRTVAGRHLVGTAATEAEKKATTRATVEAEKLGMGLPIPEEKPGVYIDRVVKGFQAELSAQEQAALAAAKAQHAAHRQEVQEGIQRGLTEAESEVDTLLRKIAPGSSPIRAGEAAQGAARQGIGLAKKEAEKLYAQADAKNLGRAIDLGPHLEELRQLAEEMQLAPTQDPAAIIAYAQKLTQSTPAAGAYQAKLIRAHTLPTAAEKSAAVEQATRELLAEQAKTGQQLVVPYEQAREMQKWIGQRISGAKFSDNLTKGRMKYLWGSLTDSIEKGIEGTPGASAFREATAFYREFSDIAKRGAAAKLVNGLKSAPDDVMKLVAQGPSRVAQLKKAIVGFADSHGTPAEQRMAREAWDELGRTYAESNLLAEGVEKLPGHLSKLEGKKGKEMLDTLYGPEVANNWREIASTISSLKKVRVPAKGDVPGVAPVTAGPEQQGALQNLEDIQGALRLMDKQGSALTSGLFLAGGGVAQWLRYLGLGSGSVGGALTPVLTAEGVGGLITWAALNKARTRGLRNALATGARYGSPPIMRLLDSYMATMRDNALLKGGAPKSPPPPPPPPPPGVSRASLYP